MESRIPEQSGGVWQEGVVHGKGYKPSARRHAALIPCTPQRIPPRTSPKPAPTYTAPALNHMHQLHTNTAAQPEFTIRNSTTGVGRGLPCDLHPPCPPQQARVSWANLLQTTCGGHTSSSASACNEAQFCPWRDPGTMHRSPWDINLTCPVCSNCPTGEFLWFHMCAAAVCCLNAQP